MNNLWSTRLKRVPEPRWTSSKRCDPIDWTRKDAGFMGGSMNSRKEALGTCEQPLVHEIETRTRAAVEALRSNRLDPMPEPEKSGRCDVQDLCPASMAGSGLTRP